MSSNYTKIDPTRLFVEMSSGEFRPLFNHVEPPTRGVMLGESYPKYAQNKEAALAFNRKHCPLFVYQGDITDPTGNPTALPPEENRLRVEFDYPWEDVDERLWKPFQIASDHIKEAGGTETPLTMMQVLAQAGNASTASYPLPRSCGLVVAHTNVHWGLAGDENVDAKNLRLSKWIVNRLLGLECLYGVQMPTPFMFQFFVPKLLMDQKEAIERSVTEVMKEGLQKRWEIMSCS